MSGLALQKPYAVATLPRPVDTATGRYVCAEVHGSEPGSRKRKRELVVGIDGEGVNLYDTSSSKIITSYALPPQSSFTCAPCSIKSRKSKKNGFERRTYISITGSVSSISLFRDVTATDGNTTNSSVEHASKHESNAVVFLDTVPSSLSGDILDLLVVHRDGEIQCLNGSDLTLQWISPASSITKNEIALSSTQGTVEFCQTIDAYSASQGLFKDRADVLSSFPQPISMEDYNPVLLAMIFKAANDSSRTLHILALPSANGSLPAGSSRSVQSIFSVKLVSEPAGPSQYELHASSGLLYESSNHTLSIYNLIDGTANLQSQKRFPGQVSFLRLSSASVVVAYGDKIDIYNPRFGSTQASIALALSASGQKRKAEEISSDTCRFISFSKSQNIIHAIRGDELLAIQIDIRQDRYGVPKQLGLLIDSIGHGDSISLAQIDAVQQAQIVSLDKHAADNDIEQFESVMAQALGFSRDEIALEQWHTQHEKLNGLQKQLEEISKPIPQWLLPATLPSPVGNQIWIKYSLQKIITWSPAGQLNDSPHELTFEFYPHNVVNWLTRIGAFSKANIEAALRSQLIASSTHEIPAGQMVAAFMEIDPSLTALLSYLSSTFLDAEEIAYAIRALMESLELFKDDNRHKQTQLINEDDIEMTNGDADIDLELQEDAAGQAIELAEYYLGDGADVRNQALKLAIVKLHAAPKKAAVQALKSIFSSTEIIAFIYLLRFELTKGSWTSKYLDTLETAEEDLESHDSNIVLITDLLNTCIDAIGSGGWLDGNALLASGDQYESEELISSLSFEVGAALVGIEESAYLKNLLGDVIRYGESVQQTSSHQGAMADASLTSGRSDVVKPKNARPIILPGVGKNSAILPFGMKAEQKISKEKIGAGGEVTRRTARDIGRLKSRKVGKYSRERIVV